MILGSAACAFGTDCSDCGVRVDADGDFHEDDPLGLGLALYSDCNDADPTINSSAYDVPDDGIDQDCDGSDASSSSGGGSSTPSSKAIAQMVLMKTKMVSQTAMTLIVLLTLHVSPLTAAVAQKYWTVLVNVQQPHGLEMEFVRMLLTMI